MSEVKLLPCPEWDGDFMTETEFREQAQDYAIACVKANLAERDAEMEALRAERRLVIENQAYWKARAERLAEALRELASQLQYADKHAQVTKDVAGEFICLPPWLWIEIRDKARAALDQETSNGWCDRLHGVRGER